MFLSETVMTDIQKKAHKASIVSHNKGYEKCWSCKKPLYKSLRVNGY